MRAAVVFFILSSTALCCDLHAQAYTSIVVFGDSLSDIVNALVFNVNNMGQQIIAYRD
jgi:phospholipase/lecithinase/hemolysin